MRIDIASIQSYYDKRAPGYDNEADWNYRDRRLLNLHIQILQPQPTDTLLDVATGTGVVGEAFMGLVRCVVGIDISIGMLRIAKRRLNSIIVGSAHELPFPSGTFDYVACRQGLHYMNPQIALREFRRVAKRRVLLSQITCYDMADASWWWKVFDILTPERKHIFTGQTVSDLMKDVGFHQITIEYYEERNSLNGWLMSKPEATEIVYQIFHSAPGDIARKYAFEFRADDVLYTHRWALAAGTPKAS